MTRHAAAFSIAAVLATGAGGCRPEEAARAPRGVAVTIPPLAAIVRAVADPEAHIHVVLPPGASPHAFEPRPSDVRAVAEARVLFFVDPSLDGWVARLGPAHARALLEAIPLASRPADDPHFWLDPVAVRQVLPTVVRGLCEEDPTSCAAYEARQSAFAARLEALDRRIRQATEPVGGRPFVTAEPFLTWYAARYGLDVAAVVEPIPGKEPSPAALEALVKTARAREAHVLFVQTQLPDRSARALAEATGLDVVALDPLGDGTDYERLLVSLTDRVVEALR